MKQVKDFLKQISIRKWIVIAYIWCVTIFTVFFFPFEATIYDKYGSVDYRFKRSDHRFIGIVRVQDRSISDTIKYQPQPMNYAGKLFLITAVFGTALIIVKPKTEKT
ncbi:hypothetical protein ES705_37533 [subsurface metagenome]